MNSVHTVHHTSSLLITIRHHSLLLQVEESNMDKSLEELRKSVNVIIDEFEEQ